MKKLIIILSLGAVLFSCDERLADLNKPTKAPESATPEALFANATRQMFDMMVETDVNANVFRLYAQYWAQTTYPDESQFNMVGRRIPDNFWLNGYRDVLMDLEQARLALSNTWEELAMPEAVRDNQYALIDINKVYTFSILVDAFGAIPFSEALDPEILSPSYDDGAEVYTDLINMLDNALTLLDEEAPAFSSRQDLIYNGNITRWRKFGNSLKLKLALTISDVDAVKAQTMIDEAIAGGVFESNADNASIAYQSSSPSTNPLWKDLVQSGRADYVVSNTFVNKLNDLNDPRLYTFATLVPFAQPSDENDDLYDSVFTENDAYILVFEDEQGNDSIEFAETPFTITVADTAKHLKIFSGGQYGNNNTYSKRSHVGDIFHQPDLEGLILDYAEVQFLLAEAAAKGLTVPDAVEEYYNRAITASMQYWGVEEAEIAQYLADEDVAYATASGDWKQKIGSQAWIALFNRGFEGWSLWRRLDFDGFNAPPEMTLEDIPNRLIFPVEEYTLNPSNLDKAVEMIGGEDDAAIKVFWDVN